MLRTEQNLNLFQITISQSAHDSDIEADIAEGKTKRFNDSLSERSKMQIVR
jgi:hypothetical protein